MPEHDWERIEEYVRNRGYQLVRGSGWVELPAAPVLASIERLRARERELELQRSKFTRLKERLRAYAQEIL
jgi:hypothetical protein